MPVAFFWINAMTPADGQEDLNKFLSSHRVLAMDRHFSSEHKAWAVAVDYAEGGRADQPGPNPDKGRVDYREVLDPATFAVFAALRTKRKELAEKEGIPAYVIVTSRVGSRPAWPAADHRGKAWKPSQGFHFNDQMAQIAKMRAASLDDLKQVPGLGESRVRRYGRALLDVIASGSPPAPAQGEPTDEA